jgi:hypothetical protein
MSLLNHAALEEKGRNNNDGSEELSLTVNTITVDFHK